MRIKTQKSEEEWVSKHIILFYADDIFVLWTWKTW